MHEVKCPIGLTAAQIRSFITFYQCDQIWRFFWTLGNFLKPLAITNWPKSPTFLGNFCKGVKMCHFPSEIIFGQLL